MFDHVRHQEAEGVANAVADDVAEESRRDDHPAPTAVRRGRKGGQRYQVSVLSNFSYFVSGKPFDPNLMFVGRAGGLYRKTYYGRNLRIP